MTETRDVLSLVDIDVDRPIWDRFFWVAPLVIIGTREGEGYDLAPKHMAFPMGWQNFFGFVCAPTHGTYANARTHGAFTVTYPRPGQLVETSLSASPRDEQDRKPILGSLPVSEARVVDGVVVDGGYLYLECELDRIVDDFGLNSLIVGRIVAARVAEDALRESDGDDVGMIRDSPLLVYLHPGRFASVGDTLSFPFPAGMRK
jgi:flavin reductase (DIM6/NTAB) family NADH-FMN oxidoreductase RutF